MRNGNNHYSVRKYNTSFVNKYFYVKGVKILKKKLDISYLISIINYMERQRDCAKTEKLI